MSSSRQSHPVKCIPQLSKQSSYRNCSFDILIMNDTSWAMEGCPWAYAYLCHESILGLLASWYCGAQLVAGSLKQIKRNPSLLWLYKTKSWTRKLSWKSTHVLLLFKKWGDRGLGASVQFGCGHRADAGRSLGFHCDTWPWGSTLLCWGKPDTNKVWVLFLLSFSLFLLLLFPFIMLFFSLMFNNYLTLCPFHVLSPLFSTFK